MSKEALLLSKISGVKSKMNMLRSMIIEASLSSKKLGVSGNIDVVETVPLRVIAIEEFKCNIMDEDAV